MRTVSFLGSDIKFHKLGRGGVALQETLTDRLCAVKPN
jgi:hypothetical protein